MTLTRALARLLLGNYQLYRIYRLRPSASAGGDPLVVALDGSQALQAARCNELRDLCQYAGEDAYGYGYREGGELLAACWYWTGRRYRENRNFWPLEEGEAKLVQIVTAPTARGRGIAGRLLTHSAADMATRGYRALYARIWHSNRPSIRAFERVGWQYIAFVADVYPPLRRRRPLRWVRRRTA